MATPTPTPTQTPFLYTITNINTTARVPTHHHSHPVNLTPQQRSQPQYAGHTRVIYLLVARTRYVSNFVDYSSIITERNSGALQSRSILCVKTHLITRLLNHSRSSQPRSVISHHSGRRVTGQLLLYRSLKHKRILPHSGSRPRFIRRTTVRVETL